MIPLFRFKGGVKPASNKTISANESIGLAPMPDRLYIPLHQSIGGTPRPLVKAGDTVLKGQLIGEADGWVSAAVHAPTSGTVLDVCPHVQPHPSGLPSLCVVIEPDGHDRWLTRQPAALGQLTAAEIRQLLQQAGVVGQGGAVFPTHGKLSASRDVPMEDLIINGAECEPFITCDDRLMRERGEDIVRGSALFRDLLGARRVLIGIEDNKPEAIAAMRAAVKACGENFAVCAIPTLYPAGGAKQLIRVLTGKEVPASKRSTDLGVQCFNVGTAYSAWRAVAHGEPVLSRIVTVTGHVRRPRNWEVPIGMRMRDLLALATPEDGCDGVIMGGPMMGFQVPDLDAPIVKATNCLIARTPELFPPPPPEMPCIRCGACADACPHELLPFELYWHARAKDFGKTQSYNIFDCIECGCCSYVCPSRIPLVQYFRFAKSEIWAREAEKKAAEGAKERFEFKQLRAEREKAEKAEKLAKAAAAQAAKKAAEAAAGGETTPASTEIDAEAAKKAAIAAAMARASAQRASVEARNTDQLTPEQQREIDAIEARRQAASQENSPT